MKIEIPDSLIQSIQSGLLYGLIITLSLMIMVALLVKEGGPIWLWFVLLIAYGSLIGFLTGHWIRNE